MSNPAVTAHYTSSTHSLDVSHPITSSGDSQKASFEALRRAILAAQADLNAFLTERKLEEDRANGVNGKAVKRKAKDEEELEEENGEDELNQEEE